jgi:hypothetical protein
MVILLQRQVFQWDQHYLRFQGIGVQVKRKLNTMSLEYSVVMVLWLRMQSLVVIEAFTGQYCIFSNQVILINRPIRLIGINCGLDSM